MDTKILTDKKEDIEIAAKIIAGGGLVAFPTETVYGLGADAMNPEAVKKIYKAKGRPSDNPTIVHISSNNDMERVTDNVTKDMKKLMEKFWPGPMTMVVKKRSDIPYVTTGNLETVGIRMPEDPVARQLIELSGCLIAAPSANLSGKPSPTTFRHVMDDLEGKIDAIICGNPAKIGIESTVIDLTADTPVILRPGYITRENVQWSLKKNVEMDPTLNKKLVEDDDFRPRAPGMKYRHYAPEAEMIIFQGEPEAVAEAIDLEQRERQSLGERVCVISYDGDEKAAAHDFFARLRQADKDGYDIILAAALPEKGIGFSVMNRMLKSASFNIRNV
mgnify:CR=1 FL=1